jgi:Fur family ferric uptake transcriptional regulator
MSDPIIAPKMRPKDFSVRGLGQYLQEQGMRMTEGRRAILQVLFAAREPLSLEEIMVRAAQEAARKPDYATVFRLVTLLEEHNLVAKVNLQRSCSYFELRDPGRHYDHLICRQCGRVILLEMPCPVREAEAMILQRYGFQSLTHSLEFFGDCPDCQTNRATA